jgi:hypothetical protein
VRTDDDAQPQYVSVLDWNVAPVLNDAMFTFDPPEDAYQIQRRRWSGRSSSHCPPAA